MVILRVDEHQLERIKGRSNKTYRNAIEPLIKFLEEHDCDPLQEEVDEILMEYKNHRRYQVTRSKFGTLIAAVMHVLPEIERLPWSSSSSRGWLKVEPPQRTAPLPGWLSPLYQGGMAEKGDEESGIVLRVQSMTGMRPSEALGMAPEDVLLDPEHPGEEGLEGCTLIRLKKTKRGRQQVVVIRPVTTERDQNTLILLRRLKERTPRGVPMARVDYQRYRGHFIRISEKWGIGWKIRPHSPRVGFATDSHARGDARTKTMEMARWEREDTFKGYLDEVASMAVSIGEEAIRLGARARYVEANLDRIFPHYYY